LLSQAYEGEDMKKSSVFEGHNLFKEAQANVEDERSDPPRSHTTDDNVEKVRNLLQSHNQPSLLCGNTEAVM
jgi:hypothetical protein